MAYLWGLLLSQKVPCGAANGSASSTMFLAHNDLFLLAEEILGPAEVSIGSIGSAELF